MSGVVNSWMQTLTVRENPCIGETIMQSGGSSSVGDSNIFNQGGDTENIDDTSNQYGDSSLSNAVNNLVSSGCLWWILGALAVGYALKGKRQ